MATDSPGSWPRIGLVVAVLGRVCRIFFEGAQGFRSSSGSGSDNAAMEDEGAAPVDTSPEIPEPRFPGVSRRAFLRRSAVVGLAAAMVPVAAACGGSPATQQPAASPTLGSADNDTPGPGSPSSGGSASASTAFASGARMNIEFTYVAAGGGRVHSPYIAVWIEDAAGDLVQTVSLWYKSDESKYLRDLRRWNSKDNRQALMTGATRLPGAFSVSWDGTNLDGRIVGDGDYFVCIEAVREDGPYQIIRELVPISDSLAPTPLTPSGELVAASVGLSA